MTTFIETREGYFEGGYGFIDDKRDGNQLSDFDYHNLTVSWTKRYGGKLSNSVRAFWALGQTPNGGNTQTADGFAILIENSLVTHKPLTLIPYANFFIGVDRPQPLVRGNDGILKNTGIAFETDGLTGFPKIDSSGQDAYGFAVGIENLFDLSRQVVFAIPLVPILCVLQINFFLFWDSGVTPYIVSTVELKAFFPDSNNSSLFFCFNAYPSLYQGEQSIPLF